MFRFDLVSMMFIGLETVVTKERIACIASVIEPGETLRTIFSHMKDYRQCEWLIVKFLSSNFLKIIFGLHEKISQSSIAEKKFEVMENGESFTELKRRVIEEVLPVKNQSK